MNAAELLGFDPEELWPELADTDNGQVQDSDCDLPESRNQSDETPENMENFPDSIL